VLTRQPSSCADTAVGSPREPTPERGGGSGSLCRRSVRPGACEPPQAVSTVLCVHGTKYKRPADWCVRSCPNRLSDQSPQRWYSQLSVSTRALSLLRSFLPRRKPEIALRLFRRHATCEAHIAGASTAEALPAPPCPQGSVLAAACSDMECRCEASMAWPKLLTKFGARI